MTENTRRYTGGCLCGALRYEAEGEPLFTGHCYCTDCQKASGSGFIPFMGFAASVYAGTLDDPSQFRPRIAIFAGSRPPWAVIPPGLKVFERLPVEDS